jgi:hypothetical protein
MTGKFLLTTSSSLSKEPFTQPESVSVGKNNNNNCHQATPQAT